MLLHMTENQDTVEVDGVTVRQCLDNLIKLYPKTRWFCGDVPSVLVLLNREIILLKDMDIEIKEGDKIEFIMMMGGG